jgi:hypothetical protein
MVDKGIVESGNNRRKVKSFDLAKLASGAYARPAFEIGYLQLKI